jgi:hypothetical protein
MSDANPSPAASLTVLRGPLQGRSVVLDQSVDEILVGSDPDCRLHLDLPVVSPIHARIWIDLEGATIHDTRSPHGIWVNDTRVEGQAPLSNGDIVWLGDPLEAESVMLRVTLPSPAPVAPTAEAPVAEPVLEAEPVVEAALEAEPAAGGELILEADLATLPSEPLDLGGTPPPGLPPGVPAASPPAAEFTPTPVLAPEPVAPSADGSLDLGPLDDEPAPPLSGTAPIDEAGDLHLDQPESPLQFGDAPMAAEDTPAEPAEPEPVEAPAALAADAEPAPIAVKPAPAPRLTPAPAKSKAAAPARAATPAKKSPPIALIGGLAAVVVLGVGGFLGFQHLKTPRIESTSPARVGVGQPLTLSGRAFASEAGKNVVTVGGQAAKVLQASETQLQIEVPELPTTPGKDTPTPIVVSVDGRSGGPGSVAVFRAPRIRSVQPAGGLAGDEVVIEGSGWSKGAKVTVGKGQAEILEVTDKLVKVKLPEPGSPEGSTVPLFVSMGSDPSAPFQFLIGRLPYVSSVEPRSAAPGDVVVVSGQGFASPLPANTVSIGGSGALVLSGNQLFIKVVVPRVGPGEHPLELRTPGSENVGKSSLGVSALPEFVDFRFYAEAVEPGSPHAALSTSLGPAIVLAAAGGKSAAERAVDVAKRLNDLPVPLRASADNDCRAEALDANPVVVCAGQTVLEPTNEDVAAYAEERAGQRPNTVEVTRARLAVWWAAELRDLTLLLVRSERPRHTAALAPEGKALGDVFDATHRGGGKNVPQKFAAELRPPLKDVLRTLGLRVPASVVASASAPAAAAAAPGLVLEGTTWAGSETIDGIPKSVQVVFAKGKGTVTYQGPVPVVTRLNKAEMQKDVLRYSMDAGARGTRYYVGTWDGTHIKGTVSSDPAGSKPIGSFDLSQR